MSTLTEHATHLLGKPIAPFDARAPFDFATTVPRLALDWEAQVDGLGMGELVAELLRRPDVSRAEALVFGVWDFIAQVNSSVIVDALVAAKDRLPKLRALFVGDIVEGEQEMPWIAQSDLAPILASYPKLEELHVRGSSGLAFAGGALGSASLAHASLRSLIIESAGLSREVVAAVLAGDFPELRHLELWLGSEQEGATVSIDDFAPLFAGERFPKLETLALCNAETADALAAAVASAPILDRIKKLDLSLGTLSDDGAQALLASERVRKLVDLDVRKSFISPDVIKQFHALSPVIVDVRGSRFGKEDGERRPSTAPPKRAPIDLPLARLRQRRRA